ncbi:MAG TPA: alkaline phosphatase family protein [Gemmatimonadales bacterium]|nr:alkaline phosphatase family protein [Gemmatimonadales bacterium]
MALLGLAGGAEAQGRPASPPIRLVLHLSVDQLRPEYLTRWGPEFTGGLAWLLGESVFYPKAGQRHAMTETAPGHATMLSGRWPRNHGILANDRGVPDRLYPLLAGATATGASPARFRGTTLYDWMRAADSGVRALSVSRKDRGAILPVGRAKVPVYWYANGRFTTSRWYADTLPTWLADWNAQDVVARFAGTAWTTLRDASTYPEPDDRTFEYGGNDGTFPHVLPDDWTMASGELEYRPVMDSLILDVAWRGVKAHGIGRRDRPDFLAVSLSTTDNIGHRWGPGSREQHDNILRLDGNLGWFLDSLATVVPREQWLVSLTADHGVQEYPEAAGTRRVSLAAEERALDAWTRARWGIDLASDIESGLLLADVAQLRARGVDVDSLSDAMATRIRAIPGVRAVYTPRTLPTARGVDAELWRRQIPATTGWLFAVSLEEGTIFSGSRTSTSHGTTNAADVIVPLLIRAPGVAPRRVDRAVDVVDLGPTLAHLLGVRPTEPLDGSPLLELAGPRRSRR